MKAVAAFTYTLLAVQCNASRILSSLASTRSCAVSKPGTQNGQATLFQEGWAYGGACGFTKPLNAHSTGYFAAVGGTDWDNGLGCGACAKLTYQGRSVVVKVVDRCGGCSTGWFDMGGPAWYDLTNNAPPGHIHGVESSWIECPNDLTGGKNLNVYVKPGSHPWDARFQPHFQKAPVTSMSINVGKGWKKMKKCENFMFCKPGGIVLNGENTEYTIRVSSANRNVDFKMSSIPGGSYVDMGSNNGGCGGGAPAAPAPAAAAAPPAAAAAPPAAAAAPPAAATAPAPAATPAPAAPVAGDCKVDGLFPDPDSCRGFIKCAQGSAHKDACAPGLVFDLVTYNCNLPANTNCGSRPRTNPLQDWVDAMFLHAVGVFRQLVKPLATSRAEHDYVLGI